MLGFLRIVVLILAVAVAMLAMCGCSSDLPSDNVITSVDTYAEAMLQDMTLSDMIYQMMYITPEALTGVGRVTAAGEHTAKSLRKRPVGGVVYFAGNLVSREQTVAMLKNIQKLSSIPLFLGVDEEGGRVARVGANPSMGVKYIPAMKTIGDGGDTNKAYEAGRILATELGSLGFNMNFAPVADVLVNPDNYEIGDRSFSSEPSIAADMVSNIVCGMHDGGIKVVLKHFPGHGSTVADSHKGYSVSYRSLEQLRETEFLPFEAGIDAGADFVMVSHMTLENAVTEMLPCSLSGEVITDMLINELGFAGIIITDSLSMGAITQNYSPADAAVKAVLAGADMLLMPPDVDTAHSALMQAVDDGVITLERIEHSVRKILLEKEKMGLLNKNTDIQ